MRSFRNLWVRSARNIPPLALGIGLGFGLSSKPITTGIFLGLFGLVIFMITLPAAIAWLYLKWKYRPNSEYGREEAHLNEIRKIQKQLGENPEIYRQLDERMAKEADEKK